MYFVAQFPTITIIVMEIRPYSVGDDNLIGEFAATKPILLGVDQLLIFKDFMV